ncbi:MAG: HAD family hydrolase [Candidatus Brocadia sp.]|jgi:D-glycero-D-manno-heptose 1,7-bisphosphate phosphatase
MKKRKAVFLDRDGTIVVHKPYLSSPEQLKLSPNAAQGIRLFREYGYLIIVVTNQSGVARGFFDEERLMLIHKRLMDMLEDEGVVIDGIYYCPHHTEGVIKQYKIDCTCRKPKPGMLLDAARKHHIDLTQSLMIGDSEVDVLAGKNAGCRCVLIRNSRIDEISTAPATGTDYIVEDLLEAAKLFYIKHV